MGFLNRANDRDKWSLGSLLLTFWSYPPQDRATDRLSLLHTDAYRGTIREQFGNRYSDTVWWFWNIIDVIDVFFTLFAYLLIYRIEGVADSNPAKSTKYHAFSPWCLYGAIILSFLGYLTHPSYFLVNTFGLMRLFFCAFWMDGIFTPYTRLKRFSAITAWLPGLNAWCC